MKRWRQYTSSAAATIALFLMVGLAFAGPGELPEQASDRADEVKASKAEKVKSEVTDTVEDAEEAKVEGDEVVNHGHCVSYWAHESKDQGLQGRARGQFISSIAQNEDAVSKKVEDDGTPDGATCDFQTQLDAAKADAAASASTSQRGGKGKAKGKANGGGSEEAGS